MEIRELRSRSEFGVSVAVQKVASIDLDSQSGDSSALNSPVVRCPECLHSDSRDAQKCVVLDWDAGSDWRLKYPHLGIRALG